MSIIKEEKKYEETSTDGTSKGHELLMGVLKETNVLKQQTRKKIKDFSVMRSRISE